MNTLITLRQGRAETIKPIDMPATPPTKAAALIADSRAVILDKSDRDYIAEVIIEIGCLCYRLETELVKTSPNSIRNGDLYNKIRGLKLATTWIEMEILHERARQYAQDNK